MTTAGAAYPLAASLSYPAESPTTTLLNFHRLSAQPSVSREQEGIEFFKTVFLDKGVAPPNGGTKPLAVRKKRSCKNRAGSCSPPLRKRRSVILQPRSPLAPRTMASERRANLPGLKVASPACSPSSVNPHQSIAFTFLTQPSTSPVPVVLVHPATEGPIPQRTDSVSSELHLGLGRFQAYDEAIHPGPSPPVSPQPSPTRRNFSTTRLPRQRIASSPRGSLSGPTRKPVHSPPMTPSRAPSKAAAILGESRSSLTMQYAKNKKSQHFRPLPASKAYEIALFFGDVPKKEKPSPKPSPRRAQSILERGAASMTGPTVSEVYSGTSTINHVGENGSLWMDVEEEQEFAWLLSEVAQHRAMLDNSLLATVGSAATSIHRSDDDEEMWDMKAFKSVLDMPKPSALAQKARIAPTAFSRPVPTSTSSVNIDSYPSSAKVQVSPGSASKHSATRASPWSVPSSQSSNNDSASLPSGSPPRQKHRPPPLTLRGKPSTNRLPLLIATAETPHEQTVNPTVSCGEVSGLHPKPQTAQALTTPFVRPRTTPVPAPRPTTLPSPPKTHQTDLPTSSDISQPQSFFEAPSPVGGFRFTLVRKMKWSMAKVVNVKSGVKT